MRRHRRSSGQRWARSGRREVEEAHLIVLVDVILGRNEEQMIDGDTWLWNVCIPRSRMVILMHNVDDRSRTVRHTREGKEISEYNIFSPMRIFGTSAPLTLALGILS